MSRRPDRSEDAVDPEGPTGDGAAPQRRAPYSDNPVVGSRGLRTQQRILDGALQTFGEHGYERTTLDKIAKVAGCSRVSIYQYFSGKDDVFRHLAGQVARQMRASAEALEPVTPDQAGWSALRAWVERYGDIHARYEPVFRAFGAAVQADATLAGGSTRTGGRLLALVQSRFATTAMPPRLLDPVSALLQSAVTRTLDMTAILRVAEPDAYRRDRVSDALTDAVHRSLFGVVPGVNLRTGATPALPTLSIGGDFRDVLARVEHLEQEATEPGRRALASLLEVGGEVVVRRGYLGVRVDDLVEAAGVSHGAFYRYFENRDDLLQVVAVRSLRALSSALGEAPVGGDRAALRRWLRRYGAVHAEHGAVIRVWVAAEGDPLRSDRAAAFDWGRRHLARLLVDRRGGDPELDGLILLAVVEAFGAEPAGSQEVDAAAHVVERGFLDVEALTRPDATR
jgi:AcrR family transcriptional regulator